MPLADTLQPFLNELAGGTPTPGGGSTAAIAQALAEKVLAEKVL